MTTDHYGPGQEARRRSRVTDASVAEPVFVLTVAQVSDGLSAGVAAVVDDTDDGYIKWTVLTVHQLTTLLRSTGSPHPGPMPIAMTPLSLLPLREDEDLAVKRISANEGKDAKAA